MGPIHLQWHLALQVMPSVLPQQTLYKNFPDPEIGKVRGHTKSDKKVTPLIYPTAPEGWEWNCWDSFFSKVLISRRAYVEEEVKMLSVHLLQMMDMNPSHKAACQMEWRSDFLFLFSLHSIISIIIILAGAIALIIGFGISGMWSLALPCSIHPSPFGPKSLHVVEQKEHRLDRKISEYSFDSSTYCLCSLHISHLTPWASVSSFIDWENNVCITR